MKGDGVFYGTNVPWLEHFQDTENYDANSQRQWCYLREMMVLSEHEYYRLEFLVRQQGITSENVWWYDGSKVMFRSESSNKFLHAMQENPYITTEELSKEAGIVIAAVKNN